MKTKDYKNIFHRALTKIIAYNRFKKIFLNNRIKKKKFHNPAMQNYEFMRQVLLTERKAERSIHKA